MNTPTIDKCIKFMNTAGGRDKVNATVQMFFRFLIQYNKRYDSSEDLLRFLNCCSSNIGNGRKFIRLGVPIENMRGASKALFTKDQFLKYCLVGTGTFTAFRYTLDMIQWIHSSGIQKIRGIKTYTKWANYFWLYALLFNIAGESYKLFSTLKKIIIIKQNIKDSQNNGEINTKAFKELIYQRKIRKLGTEVILQQSLETVDALCALGYAKLTPLTVSAIGILYTMLGTHICWSKIIT
ncbi:hypothetical protein BCR32DRAFT_268084 [Anaeromyces robustus]|uniref:Peroxisomal biogenesis factor 11 n=1 Tax=Anaeromyces robustus TaxID=1754192 RepID=A0A1Y1X7Q1_9FUNG|nr:hypothetical protein BCR32DRAFT_268084 [Anaeromyces robustus]|eukprot:ORX81787.1 hypothetical protein BCR32DRAFT_268084 [Anaeromyces robustus]